MEHVRKSSSLECIASGSWEAAIDDVLKAAQRDQTGEELGQEVHEDVDWGDDFDPQQQPAPLTPALRPAEFAAAVVPPCVLGGEDSRRPSARLVLVVALHGLQLRQTLSRSLLLALCSPLRFTGLTLSRSLELALSRPLVLAAD